MSEISEKLEKSIRKSNELVKSRKPKLYFANSHLTIKERIHMHGLYMFMKYNPEYTDKEIYQTLKSHPLKFWLLKDLCSEVPGFLEELRDDGYVRVCKMLENIRGKEVTQQTEEC